MKHPEVTARANGVVDTNRAGTQLARLPSREFSWSVQCRPGTPMPGWLRGLDVARRATSVTIAAMCGGESGPVAGLDFKSSGVHRKVGSVGSIPMHLRQFCFQ